MPAKFPNSIGNSLVRIGLDIDVWVLGLDTSKEFQTLIHFVLIAQG